MTKYFAFVTTNQPSIQPLEGCETFEAANDMVEGMQQQGEIVPWIFGIEDLENMMKNIGALLNVDTAYKQVVRGASYDVATAVNDDGHPFEPAIEVFTEGIANDIREYVKSNNLIKPS